MSAGPQTISLDATTFTIATAETSTAYKLDGSATTTETPRGNITVKAGWKDDRIVIETTAPGAAGPMVSTTSWYLDGATLVRETSVTGADGQPVVRKMSSSVRKADRERHRTLRRGRHGPTAPGRGHPWRAFSDKGIGGPVIHEVRSDVRSRSGVTCPRGPA